MSIVRDRTGWVGKRPEAKGRDEGQEGTLAQLTDKQPDQHPPSNQQRAPRSSTNQRIHTYTFLHSYPVAPHVYVEFTQVSSQQSPPSQLHKSVFVEVSQSPFPMKLNEPWHPGYLPHEGKDDRPNMHAFRGVAVDQRSRNHPLNEKYAVGAHELASVRTPQPPIAVGGCLTRSPSRQANVRVVCGRIDARERGATESRRDTGGVAAVAAIPVAACDVVRAAVAVAVGDPRGAADTATSRDRVVVRRLRVGALKAAGASVGVGHARRVAAVAAVPAAQKRVVRSAVAVAVAQVSWAGRFTQRVRVHSGCVNIFAVNVAARAARASPITAVATVPPAQRHVVLVAVAVAVAEPARVRRGAVGEVLVRTSVFRVSAVEVVTARVCGWLARRRAAVATVPRAPTGVVEATVAIAIAKEANRRRAAVGVPIGGGGVAAVIRVRAACVRVADAC